MAMHFFLALTVLSTMLLAVFIGCVPAFFKWKGSHAMSKRRRFKQETSLQDRLLTFASLMRERAALLQPGKQRDEVLRKARQADTSAHLNEWSNSPGLQSPP